MKHHRIFSASESASILLQCQTSPPHRILVADPDPFVCHLSAEILIRHGYEVNAAEDGATAWEELQAYNYHLLITEHDLPELTGLRLVKKLRAAHLDLPVVLVAERLPMRELARYPAVQLAATLLKPLAVTALLDTVKIVLRATHHPGEQMMDPHHGSRD